MEPVKKKKKRPLVIKPHSLQYFTKENQEKGCNFIVKKLLDVNKFKELGIVDFLEELGLMDPLTSLIKYYSKLLMEFYCNLTKETGD